MALARSLLPALVGGLLSAAQLGAQGSTGTISGRVTDAATQRPLSSANVVIEGTRREPGSETRWVCEELCRCRRPRHVAQSHPIEEQRRGDSSQGMMIRPG